MAGQQPLPADQFEHPALFWYPQPQVSLISSRLSVAIWCMWILFFFTACESVRRRWRHASADYAKSDSPPPAAAAAAASSYRPVWLLHSSIMASTTSGESCLVSILSVDQYSSLAVYVPISSSHAVCRCACGRCRHVTTPPAAAAAAADSSYRSVWLLHSSAIATTTCTSGKPFFIMSLCEIISKCL